MIVGVVMQGDQPFAAKLRFGVFRIRNLRDEIVGGVRVDRVVSAVDRRDDVHHGWGVVRRHDDAGRVRRSAVADRECQ